jgi:NAD(P)-dependent dehydrogenase (short-subunit alcohol dehydrogenase family)
MNIERELQGKVALVTGGGSGLGEAICDALGVAGAHVVVADIRPEAAERVAGSLKDKGYAASALRMDVTDEGEVERAVKQVRGEQGQIDIAVNDAAIDVTASIEELTVEQWDRVLATNLRGPFLVSKMVFPVMREQGGGAIVNIVSTAAKRAWANASVYHASKWGLLGLSHALHVEGRAHGIRVTAVIAGGMRTPFLLDRFPEIDLEVLQDPANVAATVRFVLNQPEGTVIPEVTVLPLKETSWP